MWIMLFSLLITPQAYGVVTPQIRAELSGYVSDLGQQNIAFRGSGGQAFQILTATSISTSSLLLAANAQVVGSSVTGVGNLTFSGTLSNGTSVAVNMNYTITTGGGLNLPCGSLPPGSPCDSADVIPLVYSGPGSAKINVSSTQTQRNVIVVINATNHAPVLGAAYKVTALNGSQLVLNFTVNVSLYNVKYTNAVTIAAVSGNLTGMAIQTVNSIEDHTALPTGISSVDSGTIQFNVTYKGSNILFGGPFSGTSTGWPLYPAVYSSGRLSTSGGLSISGSYTTTWDTPFTYVSQFTTDYVPNNEGDARSPVGELRFEGNTVARKGGFFNLTVSLNKTVSGPLYIFAGRNYLGMELLASKYLNNASSANFWVPADWIGTKSVFTKFQGDTVYKGNLSKYLDLTSVIPLSGTATIAQNATVQTNSIALSLKNQDKYYTQNITIIVQVKSHDKEVIYLKMVNLTLDPLGSTKFLFDEQLPEGIVEFFVWKTSHETIPLATALTVSHYH